MAVDPIAERLTEQWRIAGALVRARAVSARPRRVEVRPHWQQMYRGPRSLAFDLVLVTEGLNREVALKRNVRRFRGAEKRLRRAAESLGVGPQSGGASWRRTSRTSDAAWWRCTTHRLRSRARSPTSGNTSEPSSTGKARFNLTPEPLVSGTGTGKRTAFIACGLSVALDVGRGGSGRRRPTTHAGWVLDLERRRP